MGVIYNMSRKKSVLVDELNIKDSGVYCFFPFSTLDKNDKGVFKIGIAKKSIYKRSEQYHTYFPMGFYYVAFLENARVPIKTRNKQETTIYKQYREIEKFITDYLIKHGANPIRTTARILHKNENNEGMTEWFYTNEDLIHKAFIQAQKKYGGKCNIYFLKGYDESNHYHNINDEYIKELKKYKNYYIGQILYPVKP